MKLNKFITIVLIGLSGSNSYGQLTNGNEQFLFNPIMVTPSVAGMHNNQIRIGYDARWLGIEGAPRTGFINFDKMFNGNTGWNVSVESDKIGPVSAYKLSNAFSFMINTTDETRLSFGLKHHLTLNYLNLSNNNLVDPSDPLFADQTGVPVNNFDASIAWMNPNTFFIGFSYRNLIPQPRFRYTNSVVEPVLSLQGWYNHDFGETSLEAFALFNTTNNTQVNINLGVMGAIQHKIGVGLNYSPSNQIGLFTFLKLTDKMNAFYNYNMPISDIAKVSKQSHSIGISFRIGSDSFSGSTFFLQPTNESRRTHLF